MSEIVFKKSSKKKSLRKKNANLSIEDEENDDSPVISINKLKSDKKKKVSKKKIDLSFDEPDEKVHKNIINLYLKF